MHSSLLFGRILAVAVSFAFVLSACGGDDENDTVVAATTEVFNTVLTGDLEAPEKVDTAARGEASFTLDRASKTLSGQVRVTGVVPRVSHIHIGAVGIAGPVALRLTIDAATGAISLPPTVLTQEQLDVLTSGGLYVNVHSEAHPSGEIRGQLNGATVSSRSAGTGASQSVAGLSRAGLGAVAAADEFCQTSAPGQVPRPQ